ncbi:hypothetical protein FRC11_012841 [Ceratobasidium sp. 423]|nr:hypothetical protein FRC11_012841 [Ceratobasidium sp. 423]
MSSRPPTMTPKKEPTDDIIVKLECDDETKGLRLKIENMKIRCDPEDEPTSPIPDTPACKGYVIESDFVEAFLGECYYFVAPIQLDQGPSEFAVFSLSPSRRMVSLVDTNSSFHHHHIDRSFDPIVYFTIGDLPYQWDIQHGTLSSEQFGAGPSVPGLNLSGVQLYMNLGDAKALVDSLQCVNFPNLANLGLESPPLTDNNTPSPPNVADAPPPFTGAQLFDSSFRKGYFGHSPSQEEIDQWVDNSVRTDQAVRDGAHLKCPEQGCNASSRRPHALKPWSETVNDMRRIHSRYPE